MNARLRAAWALLETDPGVALGLQQARAATCTALAAWPLLVTTALAALALGLAIPRP